MQGLFEISALRPDAGAQEPRGGCEPMRVGDRRRYGRADHEADAARGRMRLPLADQLLPDAALSAVTSDTGQRLQRRSARVRGAREHEGVETDIEEGLHGVDAHPGVEGHDIGADLARRDSVGGRRAGDIAALDVEHDRQTERVRARARPLEQREPNGTAGLEEGGVGLDRGDVGRGGGQQRVDGGSERHGVARIVERRIDPEHQRCVQGFDAGGNGGQAAGDAAHAFPSTMASTAMRT